MNTFGEITEPVSRAVWEDWDSILPDTYPQLEWQQKLIVPHEIDLLLILEGKYLSDSIQMQTRNNFDLVNTIPGINLQLYKSRNSSKFICTLKDYNLVLSSEIVGLLYSYINISKDVIVMQTKSIQEYQTIESSTQDCIIRMISATKAMSSYSDVVFRKLEQPNIISGVSAGVICLREHKNLSGIAIVCYMEYLEEYQLEEVEKLLQKLDISLKTTSRSSSVLNSNLYM